MAQRQRGWVALLLFVPLLSGCSKTKTTSELLEDLKAPDVGKRHSAVRLLSQRKDEAARTMPALIDALQDKEGEIRRSAALGLGAFGEQAKDAIPALKKALNEPDARVREAATIALSRIDPAQFPRRVAPP